MVVAQARADGGWESLKERFHALLDTATAERPAVLDGVRAENPELAEELAALLECHQATGTLLSRGALADVAAGVAGEAPGAGLTAGDRIGPYRVSKEIGRGGMGAVYLAARISDFEQQVAIKRVQAGRWEAALERRFLDERQILARLDHPNIARLLDGGRLDDGSPYLVMEYIEGQPIDQYCERRRLSVRQRLELLRAVCGAVQYAHQNLVIHRDLKPSNILVTPEGVPKLLDFGIAELLGKEPAAGAVRKATLPGPMTPRYASPEQLRGEPVSTASDVYALGLIAYRLLAGRLPEPVVDPDGGDGPGWPANQALPAKPSTVARQLERQGTGGSGRWRRDRGRRRLAGDLDAVVLKALHADPRRRYPSAERLAEELRRHLAGLPVEARGAGFRYLAWKWLERRRGWLAAASLLACSLLAGGVATYHQARVADHQRARAERRFGEVRHLANAFLFDFHDAVAELPGSTEARRLVVTTALEYLERLAGDSDDDPRLLGELATAYARIGDVQGRRRNASLGDTAGALASYQRALDLLRQPALARPADRGHRRQLAAVHLRIGSLLVVQGDRSGARAHFRLALDVSRGLAARWPRDPEILFELSQAHDHMGEIQAVEGELRRALASHRRALALRRQLLAERPSDVRLRSELATSHAYVGDVLAWMDDPAVALASYRRALAIDQRLADEDPGNAEHRHRLVSCHDRIGEMHSWMQDPGAALDSYRRALALAEELAAADPLDARARRSLSLIYNRAGNALAARGEHRAALASYLRALELRQQLAASDPSNVRVRRELAVSRFKLGESYSQLAVAAGAAHKRRLLRQARDGYRRSFEILRDLVAADLLPPGDRDAPAEMASHVARCDTELAGLAAGP